MEKLPLVQKEKERLYNVANGIYQQYCVGHSYGEISDIIEILEDIVKCRSTCNP